MLTFFGCCFSLLVPITLHDRTLEAMLTLPAQTNAAPSRPTAPVTSSIPKTTNQTPPLSQSPPIIVSSPIKMQQEKEFMPAAKTMSTQEKRPEPLATFSIGEELANSSPKQIKPPPPGATHCK